MPLADLVLDVQGQTTLDASGAGSVRLSPSSTRQTWHVTNAAVHVSSNVSEPTARLYQSSRQTLIASTATGSDDSSDLDVTVRGGEIICDWAGGDAGAIATLYLQGSIHIGG